MITIGTAVDLSIVVATIIGGVIGCHTAIPKQLDEPKVEKNHKWVKR